jgi:glycosyltransferase involved in cell wall biosynthesis
LPVVATDRGQAAQVVRDRITGLLCPPDDPPALAAALERLHDDGALRTSMAKAARDLAVEQHSWERVCWRLLDIAGLQAPAIGPEVRC